METKLCQESDLPQIIEIIKQNTHMYGVDLESGGLHQMHIEAIEKYFQSLSDNYKLVGVFDNNQLISFAMMRFWEAIPAWDALLLYSSADQFQLANHETYSIMVMQKMIEIAESRNIFNFYMITRFSKLWKRWNLIFLERFTEYTVSEVEILEPFQETKWAGFKKLLGPLNGKQEKPIVILNFLKFHYDGNLKMLRKRV